MKKLLLVTTAIAGVAMMSAPASAAVKLDLGGFFRGYGVFADNNTANENDFEFRRDTEIHAGGETTLDNGLTIGVHTEAVVANGNNNASIDEVYAYASSGWGRVNFGVEDGAAYLLQVAAPSADSNVDGLRTYISGLNPTNGLGNNGYAHSDFASGANKTERLTYLTPKINGFQGGLSYAPQAQIAPSVAIFGTDNNVNTFEDLWEAAVRYDGEFEGFGFSAGAGYSDSDIQAPGAALVAPFDFNDGIKTWNVGLNVSTQGFSLGGAYKKSESNFGTPAANADSDLKTWVVGGSYDNGPWHVGASYLNEKLDVEGAAANPETDKYTIGGGYAFGPGMTFRGAVAWGEYDTGAATTDFTQVTVGTDIQF